MPALIKYERKPLTVAQICAVRDYIARKKLKEQNSDTNGVASPSENDAKDVECCSEAELVVNSPVTPSGPSAKELREEKERRLKDVSDSLAELECTLDGLKQKKHELFEEFKSLLSSENESKKQSLERERQLHGFPSPFLAQSMGQGALLNISPYRPGIPVGGIKRPKSPSPPLVQLYSPNRPSSTLQPAYDIPLGSPGHLRTHHPSPALGQGDIPRSPFQPMGSKMSGHPDSLLPGYQFQQNFSPRDPRQQIHGSQDNPTSPQASGPPCTPRERQFMDPRHVQDRHLPSFGNPQASALGMAGRDMALQNLPRQLMMNQAPFLQQNTVPGQQQATSNISEGFPGFNSFGKERPSFNNPGLQRPQGYMKRGGHPANRTSRYY